MFTKEIEAARRYVEQVDSAKKACQSAEEFEREEEGLWGDYVEALLSAMEATIEVPPFTAPWRGILPQSCEYCGRRLVGVGWGNWTLRREPYIHVAKWTCPTCLVAAAEERLAAEEA